MGTNIGQNKAVFLDRDGVLNKAVIRQGKPYPPKNLQELEICTGVASALRNLRLKKYLLIVVTNQPDVSRGKISKITVDEINKYLKKHLSLDEINTCFHDNLDNCLCRKPKPGMILKSAKRFNIDLSKSYIIGDRKSDIEAGQNAGCKTIFIDYNYNETKPQSYDLKVNSLLMASELL